MRLQGPFRRQRRREMVRRERGVCRAETGVRKVQGEKTMSVEMQDIIEEGIRRLEGITYEQIACEIAADLTAAGYGRLDVFSLTMMDQLRHGVGSLVNSLGDIIRRTELLSVERDKCEAILRIIDHAKERPVKTGGLPEKVKLKTEELEHET